MAITYKDAALKKFEADCKTAYDEAMFNGDMERAHEIRKYYEERKYDMANDSYGTMIGAQGLVGNGPYTSTAIDPAFLQQQVTMLKGEVAAQMQVEFGVLYLHNKPLPSDWAGAKITEFQRRVHNGTRWEVMFTSKWDKSLDIRLYLDLEEHNGKEINEAARTYMEALNQRRVG